MIFSIRHPRPHIQLRLFPLCDVDPHASVDELAGCSLTDVRAFALDPGPAQEAPHRLGAHH